MSIHRQLFANNQKLGTIMEVIGENQGMLERYRESHAGCLPGPKGDPISADTVHDGSLKR